MGGSGGGRGGMGGEGGPGGREGGPGGREGGKGPQAPKPISRERFDKVVTALFRAGDANHDGTITIAELNALFDARRDAMIRARFARVDTNRDGTISAEEFTVWQKQLGAVATRDDAAAQGSHLDLVADELRPELERNSQDGPLLAVIEPLNATMLARANTNYDAGVSLEELIAYEGARFAKADANGDGWLTMDELNPPKPAGMGGPGMGGRRPEGGGPDGRD